jgi:lipopolysaccharide transport system ATP-binding protein
VAAHLEPEILIVDEVLAVGDAEFQKKCLGKMGEVAKGGRTVLFVSHNMAAIERLCGRAVLLASGEVVCEGSSGDVIAGYHRSTDGNGFRKQASHVLYERQPDVMTPTFTIERIEVLDTHGIPKPGVGTWDDIILRVTYRAGRAVRRASVDVFFSTIEGVPLALCSTQPGSGVEVDIEPGVHYIDLSIERLPLSAGDYVVGAGLAIPNVEYLFVNREMARMTVCARDVFGSGIAPTARRSLLALSHSWRLG